MKTLFVSLLLLLSTLSVSFGQTMEQPLSKAEEFYRTIAKNVRYPVAASRANNVAKAYVNFTINEQGRIADIAVLNTRNVDSPFAEEIKRVLTELPAQSAADTGKYVIPIQFQLETDRKTIQAKDENREFLTALKAKKVLGEVVIIGFTR